MCGVPISLHITVPCTIPTYIAVLADMPNPTCVSPLGFQESAHLESKDPVGTNTGGSVHNKPCTASPVSI